MRGNKGRFRGKNQRKDIDYYLNQMNNQEK